VTSPHFTCPVSLSIVQALSANELWNDMRMKVFALGWPVIALRRHKEEVGCYIVDYHVAHPNPRSSGRRRKQRRRAPLSLCLLPSRGCQGQRRPCHPRCQVRGGMCEPSCVMPKSPSLTHGVSRSIPGMPGAGAPMPPPLPGMPGVYVWREGRRYIYIYRERERERDPCSSLHCRARTG
jgi:hypothetical protein